MTRSDNKKQFGKDDGMNNLELKGKQDFMGKEIPVMLGGFGVGKKCLSDKTIAEIHGMETKHVRECINKNIRRFSGSVDFIDLKQRVDLTDTLELLENLSYAKQSITQAEHIYLLSERGYSKLIKIMDTDLAWEVHDKIMDEYFQLREEKDTDITSILANPENAILLLTAYKETKDKNLLLETEIHSKNQIIGELKPKADYTDSILNNKGLVTITQIAKDYGMSGRKMNEVLHTLEIQFKQSEQWFLYSKYHDMGYTHSKTVDITHKDGTTDVKMNTKWTQKGRLFLYECLKENGHIPVIEQKQPQRTA